VPNNIWPYIVHLSSCIIICNQSLKVFCQNLMGRLQPNLQEVPVILQIHSHLSHFKRKHITKQLTHDIVHWRFQRKRVSEEEQENSRKVQITHCITYFLKSGSETMDLRCEPERTILLLLMFIKMQWPFSNLKESCVNPRTNLRSPETLSTTRISNPFSHANLSFQLKECK
jgi:hypothetical protein